MNKKTVRTYCLTLPLVREDYPFGPDIQVFKIKEKLFALMTTRQGIERVNLKCDPEEAIILREIFDDVIPGYHMNKMHWNTIILSGSFHSKATPLTLKFMKGSGESQASLISDKGVVPFIQFFSCVSDVTGNSLRLIRLKSLG